VLSVFIPFIGFLCYGKSCGGGKLAIHRTDQEGHEGMDMKNAVGETAGKIWETLSAHGPQTLAQLKKKVDGSGDLVNFALGWLAREDKIDIVAEKKTFRVQLRQAP
jgi:Winged helix-turn-helix domain (DUF2582)